MSSINGMTVNLRGLAALQSRMSNLPKDLQTKIGQAANRAGAGVAAKAIKAAAPVSNVPEGKIITRHNKGGTTRQEVHRKISNNIKVKKTKATSTTRVQNTVTAAGAYQASFVEFGSIHNTPNPFFRTGFEQSQQSVIDQIAKILDKRLIKNGQ